MATIGSEWTCMFCLIADSDASVRCNCTSFVKQDQAPEYVWFGLFFLGGAV